MQLIQQPDTYSCGLVCVAMIAGRPYQEIKELAGDGLANREGCRAQLLWYLLSYLGYSCRVMQQGNHNVWPILESEYNILSIMAPMRHWVLYYQNKVYDPARKTLQELSYYDVPRQIIGVNAYNPNKETA